MERLPGQHPFPSAIPIGRKAGSLPEAGVAAGRLASLPGGWRRGREAGVAARRSAEDEVSTADGHHVARHQLPAAPVFRLAVHPYPAASKQSFDVRALLDQVRQLQELPEPDATAGHADLSHPHIMPAAPVAPDMPAAGGSAPGLPTVGGTICRS